MVFEHYITTIPTILSKYTTHCTATAVYFIKYNCIQKKEIRYEDFLLLHAFKQSPYTFNQKTKQAH